MQEHGLLTLPDSVWAEAKHRTDVIGPLAGQAVVGRAAADVAAAELGLSRRQIYRLVKQHRTGNSLLTDLAPGHSAGGKGKARLTAEVEGIIKEVLSTLYLSRQKPSISVMVKEIRMRCIQAGYGAPARNTVCKRILSLDPIVVARKREGSDAAKRLCSAAGDPPEPAAPLERVQMDHTPVDLIIVEESSREPIGRPHLTLAIDVFTRCIVGMLLTLEPPSATSVGLCLAHSVTDKTAWLVRLGLTDVTWPMKGKPELIHLDNAKEFKSEALKRGCEQHGINRDYRPKKQAHYGGIIERVIGTAMKKIHELPGTTFSNIQERGSYDSEAKAILTLGELEKWLTLAIVTYHETVHSALWEPPAATWKKKIQLSKVFTVSDEKAFLIDFLPVERRSISRKGFIIDYITYYADVLKVWIASRDRLDRFILRRDPRDLSRIWMLDPTSKEYLEIPYKTLSNPAVTLWEHRAAIKKLREDGRAEVDETALFRMHEQMRQITDAARQESMKKRRQKARRSHLETGAKQEEIQVPCPSPTGEKQAPPFDDIEEW